MIPQEKKKAHRLTNIILLAITLVIVGYILYVKCDISFGLGKPTKLVEHSTLINLEENGTPFIGVNDEQIFKVSADGIASYNFEGTEIWSDTFSMHEFVVAQEASYIAVGGKGEKQVILFGTKGKISTITTNNPIVSFSVNELGGLVTIEDAGDSYIITAYDRMGKMLCRRVSYTSTDGYPTAATLSPDNSLLIISNVSVDEPQVTSSILAINVSGNPDDKNDNILFGYIEKNNLVYKLQYVNKTTWACIGDKAITWYDNNGTQKGTQTDLSLVFMPQAIKSSLFNSGFLTLVYSEKPTQNVIHRQDQVAYYDAEGKTAYQLALEGSVESMYVDQAGIVLENNGIFKGYNKLCNEIFEYTPTIDISKVIYLPSIKKGIAVGKDKVILLLPKKEKNK